MNYRNNETSSAVAVEIDISFLFRLLWKRGLLITTVTAIFAFTSIVYALSLPDLYRAESVLTPAEDESDNTPFSGQLGLAANLTGINLNQESPKIRNAIAIMESRDFLRKFIDEYDLTLPLLASKWDKELGQNIIDPAIYDVNSDSWISGKEPRYSLEWESYEALREILTVSLDINSGLVVVAIEWRDPAEAAKWVNWIVAYINNEVKEADLAQANNAIDYLTERISSTQLIEMQRNFNQLIESQLRIVMLADVRDEYLFEVIDPAFIPEEKVGPGRALISILGTMLGFLSVSMYVFLQGHINFVRNHE